MSTLYRKYRPQSFKDLIGQNHIKITLQHELERGEIGHAYLFTGLRGLGKTTTARLFAKSVNCENRQAGESEPCNQCSSCLGIVSASSIDVIEIDAASHTGVDNVRENIIENARFTPNKSKYKVFIIDEVHMLSTSAFNALLKTLEEPPSHAIFILCTTEIHKVPQTIISRCQRFDFKRVSSEDLLKRLQRLIKEEGKKVEEKVLKDVIVYSENCVRDAESLLGKILTLGDDISAEQAELVLPRSDYSSVIAFLEFLLEKNSTAAIELINKLVEDGVDLSRFADDLVEFLRKILLVKTDNKLADFGIELDEAQEKAVEKFAGGLNYGDLIAMVELFLAKRQELKSAPIQQLPLEMAVIGLGNMEHGTYNIEHKTIDVADKIVEKKIEAVKAEGKAEVKEEKEAVKEKLESDNPADFDKIEKNWSAVVEKLTHKNYSLSALLKISRPLACRGQTLDIAVPSKFFQERLMEMKNKDIVENAILESTGSNAVIRALIQENVEPLAELIEPATVDSPKADEGADSAPAPVPTVSRDVAQEVVNLF